MMSGRLSTSSSLQPSLPQKSSRVGLNCLNTRAHRAVVDDDALPNGFEKVTHVIEDAAFLAIASLGTMSLFYAKPARKDRFE